MAILFGSDPTIINFIHLYRIPLTVHILKPQSIAELSLFIPIIHLGILRQRLFHPINSFSKVLTL